MHSIILLNCISLHYEYHKFNVTERIHSCWRSMGLWKRTVRSNVPLLFCTNSTKDLVYLVMAQKTQSICPEKSVCGTFHAVIITLPDLCSALEGLGKIVHVTSGAVHQIAMDGEHLIPRHFKTLPFSCQIAMSVIPGDADTSVDLDVMIMSTAGGPQSFHLHNENASKQWLVAATTPYSSFKVRRMRDPVKKREREREKKKSSQNRRRK